MVEKNRTNPNTPITFNQAYNLGKDQIGAIATLGFQLYEQGKVRDAESIFNGLTALDPKSYYGYAGLGALALSEQKLDEAVKCLTKAAELNPNDATVHANLGEAYLRQAKFNESAAEFKRSMDLDPKEVDPGANRARAIVSGVQIVVSELQRMHAGAH